MLRVEPIRSPSGDSGADVSSVPFDGLSRPSQSPSLDIPDPQFPKIPRQSSPFTVPKETNRSLGPFFGRLSHAPQKLCEGLRLRTRRDRRPGRNRARRLGGGFGEVRDLHRAHQNCTRSFGPHSMVLAEDSGR